MQIAVFTPREFSQGSVENHLTLAPLRALFPDHEFCPWHAEEERDFPLYLFVGDQFLEEGFQMPAVPKTARLAAIGVSVDPGMKWTDLRIETLRLIARSGGVGAADEVSYKTLRQGYAGSGVYLAAHPALFAVQSSFVQKEPLYIWNPTSRDPAFTPRQLERLNRAVFRRWSRKNRALCLVQDASVLGAAAPGVKTFYEPLHPALHAKALVSAAGVAGGNGVSLLAAAAAGVPALYVGNDPVQRSLVESAGIPFFQINPNTHPAEVEHRAQETFRQFAWPTFQSKTQKLKDKFLDQMKELGLRAREIKRRPLKLPRPGGQALAVASMVSGRDLIAFTGLVENLREQVGCDVHFHVLALDASAREAVEKYLGTYADFYPLEKRGSGLQVHSTRVLRALNQGSFLKRVVEQIGAPVLYLDPKAALAANPQNLLALERGHTLLFPLWNDADGGESARLHTEVGVFCPASVALLQWWAEAAQREFDTAPHLAGSSGFLSFAPYIFAGARIYRGKDHAVCVAGRKSLGLTPSAWPSDPPRLLDGTPVASFLPRAETCAFARWKTAWDQLCFAFSGVGEPAHIAASTRHQQAAAWPEMASTLAGLREFGSYFPWIPRQFFDYAAAWLSGGPARHWVRHWAGRRPAPAIAEQPSSAWGEIQRKYLFDTDGVSEPLPLARSA